MEKKTNISFFNLENVIYVQYEVSLLSLTWADHLSDSYSKLCTPKYKNHCDRVWYGRMSSLSLWNAKTHIFYPENHALIHTKGYPTEILTYIFAFLLLSLSLPLPLPFSILEIQNQCIRCSIHNHLEQSTPFKSWEIVRVLNTEFSQHKGNRDVSVTDKLGNFTTLNDPQIHTSICVMVWC